MGLPCLVLIILVSKILLFRNAIKYLCTTAHHGPQFQKYTARRATTYRVGFFSGPLLLIWLSPRPCVKGPLIP